MDNILAGLVTIVIFWLAVVGLMLFGVSAIAFVMWVLGLFFGPGTAQGY